MEVTQFSLCSWADGRVNVLNVDWPAQHQRGSMGSMTRLHRWRSIMWLAPGEKTGGMDERKKKHFASPGT